MNDKRSIPNLKLNYVYNLLYQIISILIPFITMPYVSHVLGVENIGIYSYVNANANYFILLGVFGLTTYSQYEVSKKRDDLIQLKRFCTESFLTRSLTVIASCVIYVIVFIFGGKTNYRIYYLIQLIAVLSYSIDMSWIYQGLESFKTLTMRNLIVKVSGAVAIFAFVKTPEDLWKYIAINAVAIWLGNFVVLPKVVQYFDKQFLHFHAVWDHIKKSSIYFLPSIASTLISTIDKLMIGWFTDSKVENGYYEQAYNIEMMVFMLFASLSITMRPRMAYLYKNSDKKMVDELMKKSLAFVLFLALPVSVGICSIADIFVPWYFGVEFQKVAVLLKIMSGWIFIRAISNCLVEQAIVPNNGQVLATKIIWISAVCNVVLNAILIPHFYSIGATIASLITEVVFLVMVLRVLKEKINVRGLMKDFAKECVGVLFMYGVLKWLGQYSSATPWWTLGMIIFGGGIYFIIELMTKNGFLGETIRELVGKINKRGERKVDK